MRAGVTAQAEPLCTAKALPKGAWTHVAAVYDSASKRRTVMLNGTVANSDEQRVRLGQDGEWPSCRSWAARTSSSERIWRLRGRSVHSPCTLVRRGAWPLRLSRRTAVAYFASQRPPDSPTSPRLIITQARRRSRRPGDTAARGRAPRQPHARRPLPRRDRRRARVEPAALAARGRRVLGLPADRVLPDAPSVLADGRGARRQRAGHERQRPRGRDGASRVPPPVLPSPPPSPLSPPSLRPSL